MKRFVAVIGLTLAGVCASAANATETKFAHFNSIGSTNDFTFVNASKSLITNADGSTTTAPVNVLFNYENSSLSSLGQLASTLTYTATTTQPSSSNPGGMRDEMGFAGSFEFDYVGTLQVGATTYSGTASTPVILLKGTFTDGDLNGVTGSQTANYTDSTSYLVDPDDDDSARTTDPTRVVFSSDLLDFSDTVNRDYGLTLNPVTPSVGVSNGSFKNFQAVASGDFSSDPAPLVTAVVPETATWAMMLVGFGAVGGVLRTSRNRKPLLA